MWFNTRAKKQCAVQIEPVDNDAHQPVEDAQAELRRLMYERIARGNALISVEEHALRKRQGK